MYVWRVNYQPYYESLTPGYWCPVLTKVEVEE